MLIKKKVYCFSVYTETGRVDIPGTFYHVIVRGIERSDTFLDDYDRHNFYADWKLLLVNPAVVVPGF